MSSQALTLHCSGLRSRRPQNNSRPLTLSLSVPRRRAAELKIRLGFQRLFGLVALHGWHIFLGLIATIFCAHVLVQSRNKVHHETTKTDAWTARPDVKRTEESHTDDMSQATTVINIRSDLQGVKGVRLQPSRRRASRKEPLVAHQLLEIDDKYTTNTSKSGERNSSLTSHQRQNPQSSVEKAHGTQLLAGKEQKLRRLPHTHWLHNAALKSFAPRHSPPTGMRLITLGQACYCTYREQFLLPKVRSHGSFPGFLRRHNAARHIPWKRPAALLARRGQTAVYVKGITVLWRGRAINVLHPHLQRALLPIRSVLDEISRTPFGTNVKLAVESFTKDGKTDPMVAKLQEYYIGDVPPSNRISLQDHRPRLLCFDRVVSLGTEFEGHAASQTSFNRVKDLVERFEKNHMTEPLVRDCRENRANKQTLWILDRQEEDATEGTIKNTAEVTTAVNHELMRAGLAEVLEVKTIQGPYVPCAPGTSLEGCLATHCDVMGGPCAKKKLPLLEVSAFNNMTIVIATSGPALSGLAYMPKGASVIEVVPHGVMSTGTDKDIANSAEIDLWQMQNKPDASVEHWLRHQFGDVAVSGRDCWSDDDCRAARLSVATKIDVHHLKGLLRKVFKKWRRSCRV